jgi:non-canonical purine NTP pyrophosphatase (RdgB/HAM1 family)
MLAFATSNAGKLREATAILGVPLAQLDLDLPEIQALDVETVVREKALAAHRAVGRATLVDDTGFAIEAWGGLPGALVRWFVTTVGPAGICRMLDGAASRAVVVTTAVAFHDGAALHISTGSLRGVVTAQPRGTNGFGWDAIFQPDGHAKTFAEMTDDEKNAISPRRLALEELRGKVESR